MIRIENKNVSGFASVNPVFIFDKDNVLFYTDAILTKKDKRFFNLPKGIFYSKYPLKRLKKPVIFDVKLPKFERNKGFDMFDFRIIYDDNPNKCTIFYNKKIILFDNQFKNVSNLVKDVILYHEWGHKYYQTEYKCDIFVFYKMLKKGYNPSQIKIVFLNVLSKNQRNYERMKKYFKLWNS